MALKTNIEAVTWRNVGFAAIDKSYAVDGTTYQTCVALYDTNGSLVEMDSNNTRQFNGLASGVPYILQSVYYERKDTVKGVIPDTSIEFETEHTASYIPKCAMVDGVINVDAFSADSIWMPENEGIQGFGVGVELCDSNGNAISRHSETPCLFENLTASNYIVRSYEWHGREIESSRNKSRVVPNTAIDVHPILLDVFGFPDINWAELHIRLQGFENVQSVSVEINGEQFATITEGLTNRVYVVRINDLEDNTEYPVKVNVLEGSSTISKTIYLQTKEDPYASVSGKKENAFKDFYIAVGQPGAYSKSMVYDEVFGVNARFGIKVKHAPYSPMAKIKNVVVQSWRDEDGDDVWLPRATTGQTGRYKPAIAHDAVDYNVKFVIFADRNKADSNAVIRELCNLIEGKWLKVWDEYTQMGFEGVYLIDIDDDPKFKRRNYDHVEFTLKFKVNGTNIDAPFEGVG